MIITVHRGSHQIGGTCIEIAEGNTRIIFDAGHNLPALNVENESPTQEPPKVNGLYKNNDTCSIDAVFFSHYHDDHVGFIDLIKSDIPIYIGKKAAKIMNAESYFIKKWLAVQPTAYYDSGQPIKIGNFTVTPYLVDHSAFDAYAFVIEANNKYVVYTGDLRMHGRKAQATMYFINHLPKRVDMLLLEGTMMSRNTEPVPTEKQIEQQAYEFMNRQKGPVFVMQSSINIDRLVSMYRAAKRNKRIFVMDIFMAHIVTELGDTIPNPYDFKDVRVFYPKELTKCMYKDEDGKSRACKFAHYKIAKSELEKRRDYCMLVRDIMLYDMQHIENITGAGLIFSMWQGNLLMEKKKQYIRYCERQQMEVVYLHTSGHADIKALHKIVEACNPSKIIPIHTEYPERYNDEFTNVVVVQDGEPLTI